MPDAAAGAPGGRVRGRRRSFAALTLGAIGVVFTFLTWFILIGGVIVLGAAVGAVWQQRTTRRTRTG